MMSQTNLGNAMIIVNNTAHSLAQNAALVAWAETRIGAKCNEAQQTAPHIQ